MQTEIEVKFLNVEFDALRAELKKQGATCEQSMRLMRRALIRTPAMTENGRDDFIRIRDEGDKVTLTFKAFKERSLTGAQETEVVVSDYDKTLAIFAEGGLLPQSIQESRRETWSYLDVEVVLDEWPWLNPYIEIEGPTEQAVKEAAAALHFSWDDAVFGSATVAFMAQYPDGKDPSGLVNLPEVKFGAPLPAIFKPA